MFESGRLVRAMPVFSGGADRRVRVVLEALVSGYQAQMAQATAATRAFGANVLSSATTNKAAFNTLGIAAIAMGGAMVLGLKKAVGAAIEFDSSLTKMVTQIGLTREEVEELGAAALNMGHTGKGPRELAEALFFITSAGLRGADALDVLEASAKASSIGLGTTAEVADVVTSAVNAYGIGVLSASEATDVLIGAVREGKVAAPELAGAFGKVLPIAAEMGVTFHEVGAAIAAMTRTGTDAATASTQLRAMLVQLLNPAKQARETMDEFGLSARGIRDTVRSEGLFAALQELRGAFGDNDTAIAKIFPNVRALAGVLDLTGANVQTNVGIFERMKDVVGATDEAFEEWSGSTEAAGARFSAAMDTAQVSIGSVLLPALTTLINTGTGVVDFFNDLPGPLKAVAAGFLGISGPLLLFSGGMLLLLPRIAATKAAMGDLNFSLAGVGRFLSGPWGIALIGATVGLGLFMKAQADAKARVQELTAAIEADSGALGENTQAVILNRLEKEGLLKAAEGLGISLDLVSQAALGDRDALGYLNNELDALAERLDGRLHPYSGQETREQAQNIDTLRGGISGLNSDVSEATSAVERKRDATVQASGATNTLAEAQGGLAEALGLTEDELAAVKTAADLLAIAFDELFGNTIAAEKASLAWKDSLASLAKQLKGNDAGLDANTQKGRDNRKAVLSSIDAAFEHAKQVAEQTGSVEQGTRAFGRHVDQLISVAQKAGLSKKEIKDYLRELDRTPKDIETIIKLAGVDKAEADLARLTRTRTIPVNIALSSTKIPGTQVSGRHAGGPIQRGRPYLVGERGPELIVPDHSGQVMANHQLAMMRDGGGSSAPAPYWEGPKIAGLLRTLDKLKSRFDSISSKVQDRLGKVIDQLAEEHKDDAKELGALKREYVRQAKELQREGERVTRMFERLRARMEEFSDGVRSGFQSISGLGFLSNLTDPRDIAGALIDQTALAGQFASALSQAAAMGLNSATLSELASGGLGNLGLLQGIIAGGESLIRQLNLFESSMKGAEETSVAELETHYFGEELKEAKGELREFREEVRAFNRSVTKEVEAFVKGINADGVDQATKKLIRSLEKLAGEARNRSVRESGGPGPGSAGARSVTRIENHHHTHVNVENVFGNNDLDRVISESVNRTVRSF